MMKKRTVNAGRKMLSALNERLFVRPIAFSGRLKQNLLLSGLIIEIIILLHAAYTDFCVKLGEKSATFSVRNAQQFPPDNKPVVQLNSLV